MTAFIFDINQRLTTSTSSVETYNGGLPFDASGGIVVADGTGAPTSFSNGIPFDGGAVAVDATNAIANYMNGFPFTANGRIAVSTSTPVDSFSNGLPFVGGKLCVTTASSATPNMQTVVASCCGDLDATVPASYTSGQTWANLVSTPADGTAQTAYDFFLGTDGSAGANDPTFSTNEFLLDGGDWFTIANGNTALINNWHKTTGGAPASIAMVVSCPTRIAASNPRTFFGDYARITSNTGILLDDGTDYGAFPNTASLSICGASYNDGGNIPTVTTCTDAYLVLVFTYKWTGVGEWKVYAGSSTPNVGTNVNLYSGATADASLPFQVCAGGSGFRPLGNGSKIKAVSFYNAELSDANVTAIRAEYSSRHGASY